MKDHIYAFLAYVKFNALGELDRDFECKHRGMETSEEARQRLAIGHLQAAVLECKPRFARKVTPEQYLAASEMLRDEGQAARICKLLKLDEEKKTTVRKDASGTTYIEVAP
jgi:hypothetical protein